MEKMAEEKMKKLLKNEEFVKKISQVGSAEELQKAFKNEGVEVPLEEVKLALEKADEIQKKYQNGELSESDLENIAGGVEVNPLKIINLGISAFTAGVALTSLIGVLVVRKAMK